MDAVLYEHLEPGPVSIEVGGLIEHAPLENLVPVNATKTVTIAIDCGTYSYGEFRPVSDRTGSFQAHGPGDILYSGLPQSPQKQLVMDLPLSAASASLP